MQEKVTVCVLILNGLFGFLTSYPHHDGNLRCDPGLVSSRLAKRIIFHLKSTDGRLATSGDYKAVIELLRKIPLAGISIYSILYYPSTFFCVFTCRLALKSISQSFLNSIMFDRVCCTMQS